MIDLISRKLALQASTNASTALAAITSRAPNLAVLGAIGDGNSPGSDQAGFAAAIAASVASLSATGLSGVEYQAGSMIEPGIYDAGNLSQAAGSVRLVARVPGSVIIRIPAGQYFMTVSGKVTSVEVDGIIFYGGKGAFNFTNTGNNVTNKHSFTRNVFFNYTECAILNASNDQPYLIARDNVFMGKDGVATVGIAWGGYTDNGLIENNAFLRNAYHVKLGASGQSISSSTLLRHNDFICFGDGSGINLTRADIWLVPSTLANGVNSGFGTKITENKFGNENQNPAAPRILIALEDTATGSNRATHPPLTTSGGFLTQLIVSDNVFAGGGTITAPVIRCATYDLRNMEWRGNKFTGSPYSYIVEHTNRSAANSYYPNTNSDFTFTEADCETGSYPAAAFSNAPFCRLHDFGGYFPGDANAVEVYAVSDSPALGLLASGLSPSVRAVFGGASSTATADPRGGISYGLVTATSANQGVAMAMGTGAMAGGGMVFIELGLQQAPGRALSRVVVDVFNAASGSTAFQRSVSLPAAAGRLKIPVFLPSQTSPASWQLRVYAAGTVTSGSADQFITGDWLVNSGTAPMGRDRALGALYANVVPRNQTMAGAAIGSFPTDWTAGLTTITGIAFSVVGAGSYASGTYVDVRVNGTASANGVGAIYPMPGQRVRYNGGMIWHWYTAMSQVAGDMSTLVTQTASNGTSGKVLADLKQYNTAGTYVGDTSTAYTPNGTPGLYGASDLTMLGTANFEYAFTPNWQFSFAAGVAVDFTLRIFNPDIRRIG